MNKPKTLALVVVAAALLGAGGYVYTLREQATTLQAKVDDQADALRRAKEHNEKLAEKVKGLEDNFSAREKAWAEGDGQLKASIDAFAKQAASCERVKRELHYTES